MKKKLLMLGVLLSFALCFNANINAEYIDNETPTQEKNEDEAVEEEYLPKTRARAALTIPTEGVYDTIKDTKNSAGVMTARSYYYKSKLVEKRTYTSTGSTDCRMKNKYLYYSNGSTVYIHRTYSNTKDVCYNLQTKRYNEKSQIQAHSIYEGKVNGKIIENRYYEATGTYYTQKAYYKNGIVTSRDYWKGSAGNYITHTARYNSAGTEWLNATYYYEGGTKIKEYITYNGVTGNNHRTSANGYDEETGMRTYYISYNANGNRYQVNNYDDEGFLTMVRRYHTDSNIYDWVREYQEGSDKIDIITYRDTSNEIIRKLRYFKDGTHLRWDINYVDGEKKSVKLYDNKNNYEYKETYNYTETDKSLEKSIKEKIVLTPDTETNEVSSEFEEDKIAYSNIESTVGLFFPDEEFINIIEERVELSAEDASYLEDYKMIDNLTIYDKEIIDLDGIRFLNNIKNLTISNTKVETINDDFKYLSKLEKMDLSNNNISIISEEMKTLEKITHIELKNNKINDVKDIFDGYNNMEYLGLEGNKIISISKGLFDLNNRASLKTLKVSKELFALRDIENSSIKSLLNSEFIKMDGTNKIEIRDEFTERIYKEDENLNYRDIILTKFMSEFIKEELSEDYDIKSLIIEYASHSLENQNFKRISEENIWNENILKNSKFNEPGSYNININISNSKISIQQKVLIEVYKKTAEEISNELNKEEKISLYNFDDNTQDDEDQDETESIEVVSQTKLNVLSKQNDAMDELETIEDDFSIATEENYGGSYFDDDNKLVVQYKEDGIENDLQNIFDHNNSENLEFQKVQHSYDDLEDYGLTLTEKINDNENANIAIDEEINGISVKVSEDKYDEVADKLKEELNSSLNRSTNKIKVKLEKSNEVGNYIETAGKKKYNNRNGRVIFCHENLSFATTGFRVKKYVKPKGKNGKWIKGVTTVRHLGCPVGKPIQDSDLNIDMGKTTHRNKTYDAAFIQLRNDKSYQFKPTRLLNKVKVGYNRAASSKRVTPKNQEVFGITHNGSLKSGRAIWVIGKITNTGALKLVGGKTQYVMNVSKQLQGGDSGGPLVTYAYNGHLKKTEKLVIGHLLGHSWGQSSYMKSHKIRAGLGATAY